MWLCFCYNIKPKLKCPSLSAQDRAYYVPTSYTAWILLFLNKLGELLFVLQAIGEQFPCNAVLNFTHFKWKQKPKKSHISDGFCIFKFGAVFFDQNIVELSKDVVTLHWLMWLCSSKFSTNIQSKKTKKMIKYFPLGILMMLYSIPWQSKQLPPLCSIITLPTPAEFGLALVLYNEQLHRDTVLFPSTAASQNLIICGCLFLLCIVLLFTFSFIANRQSL